MNDYRQQVKNLRAEAMHQKSRFSHYILAAELEEAAKSIETLCQENEEMKAAAIAEEPPKTVFQKITASHAALAAFLASIVTPGAPWDEAFHAHFCAKCPAENCDNCPNEAERNSPAWWLGTEV